MAQRSFQKRAQYQEGRKVRGSRQSRAMGKSTSFGRKEQEAAWKNAEVDALYQLVAAGVRVPRPLGLLRRRADHGAGGRRGRRPGSAPRGGGAFAPRLPVTTTASWSRQVVRCCASGSSTATCPNSTCCVAPDGPVIIDLPQAVNAAGNNAALAMLERDVNNLRTTLGRFAPELLATEFAREMWALFEQGELRPDSELTGVFALDQTVVDPDDVLLVIDDAREEEIQRQLRLAG